MKNGEQYMELPPQSSEDIDTMQKVEWWNAKLAELGDANLKIVAGAHVDITDPT